jgi:membrane-associated phospholipid phosphatase
VPALVGAALLLLDYHWLSDLVGGLALAVLVLRVLHGIDAVTLRHWPGGNDGGPAGGGAGRRPGLVDRPRAGIG